MNFVYGEGAIAYALGRLPFAQSFHNAFAIGIIADDRMLGAVVYDNYRPEYKSIGAHIVVTDKRALSRKTLRRLFHYPFVELGLNRISCFIDSLNEASVRLCERLGFSCEGKCSQGSIGGNDLLIYGMLKGECKWL